MVLQLLLYRTYTATKETESITWLNSFGTILGSSQDQNYSQEYSQEMDTAVSDDSVQELIKPQAGCSKENTGTYFYYIIQSYHLTIGKHCRALRC